MMDRAFTPVQRSTFPTGSPHKLFIHPEPALLPGLGYPHASEFEVCQRDHGKGSAVYTRIGHMRGDLIARFTGAIVPYRTQHSLQVNSTLHVLDNHFAGFLAHSCAPNVFVNMQDFEIWALQDIAAGSILSMDYAATEDELYRQFACQCGAADCRQWVTGRKEKVNTAGLRHLEALRFHVDQRAQA